MKYKWMLKNVQLRTSEKDDYKAAQEVAAVLKKSKKFDGTKIFLCKQVAGIVVPKGEKQDPYIHSFTFVSNDKDELQKLADNFNKTLFPNHEKDELLGVNVRKNTDNYEDVFESEKIKAEESAKIEEAANKKWVLQKASDNDFEKPINPRTIDDLYKISDGANLIIYFDTYDNDGNKCSIVQIYDDYVE